MITIKFDAPDTVLDINKLIEESVAAVEDTVADSLKDFETTTATFDDPVDPVSFTMSVKATPQGVVGTVSTNDENYARLNKGFTVAPVVGKGMSLYPGYVPKTFPGVIRSRRGGNLGSPIYRTKRRGFTVQGRRFDLAVANRNRSKFFRRVANATKGAVK
jgi:hypothetical protein